MKGESSGKFDKPPLPIQEREIGGLSVDFLPAEGKRHRQEALFIPGSGLTSKSGITVLEGFSRSGFDSMSVNLKGRRGELPASEFAHRGMADFNADIRTIREALVQQGLPHREHILVGHSSGGRIAMEQAKEHAPAALILLCPTRPKGFPRKPPQEGELERLKDLIAQDQVIKRGRSSILRWFGDRIPEDFDENYESKYKPMFGYESNQAFFDTYTDPADIQQGDITCPTLVAGATFDNPHEDKEFAQFLGAGFMEMNAGHMLMFEKDWLEFERKIMSWLEKHV